MLKSAICFDDVLLIPQFSEITTRADIDVSSNLENSVRLRVPIISSPMDTITESTMAAALHKYGAMGIIHRYNSIEGQTEHIKKCRHLVRDDDANVGFAVGVSGDFIERATAGVRAGANLICIDVAHGHHALMRYALETLRKTLGSNIHIMAGNVATLDGVNDLADWGADSIRIGIGGGSICSTRIQTGHGLPTLQSILDCSCTDRDVKLIADGGIRNSGDIVKALAAGADAVMLGSLFAGTVEAPGEIVRDDNGNPAKAYRGMASKEAQVNWRGKSASEEGVATIVPFKGPTINILKSLELGIRSGFSYSGCQNLSTLQSKSNFIKQSISGVSESDTHIYKRSK